MRLQRIALSQIAEPLMTQRKKPAPVQKSSTQFALSPGRRRQSQTASSARRERGVTAPHTHAVTSRFIVDLQVIPAVREFTHLPVIVDPSHSTFRRRYVAAIARGAIAVGADGIIIDVHPTPEQAAVDPLQALDYQTFGRLMEDLAGIGKVLERTLV